jgi:hypothetical protein
VCEVARDDDAERLDAWDRTFAMHERRHTFRAQSSSERLRRCLIVECLD